MALHIAVQDDHDYLNEKQLQQVKDLLQFAADQMKVGNAELSLTFVDNPTIHKINLEYRGKDYPTDVISFALEEITEEEVPIIGEDVPRVLGDIIVSVPKAVSQAEEYGHSFEREIGFLVVHGFLHLLGYDHMEKADEQEMFALQEDILNKFGLTRS
ncbi:rRNA maturation RNase YbeY [Tuberibacillus calidus]|uniref:rRNA maturation RNase YbeY n=1 Tax=Tuberibacillus calidus TaxID=340097 RepID=UPI0004289EA9|nr:rRNA maturation RNase YbeY [Tuberibacillus calidus]